MARSPQWTCISGCGACCRLDPEARSDALAALDAEQQQRFLAMVGEDGWCIHFDTGARRCRIYEERPEFCRVANLISLFAGISGDPDSDHDSNHDSLAIQCCREQIRAEYGGRGRVMRRFEQAIRQRR